MFKLGIEGILMNLRILLNLGILENLGILGENMGLKGLRNGVGEMLASQKARGKLGVSVDCMRWGLLFHVK
jgi:hypothetical protein